MKIKMNINTIRCRYNKCSDVNNKKLSINEKSNFLFPFRSDGTTSYGHIQTHTNVQQPHTKGHHLFYDFDLVM